MAEGSTLCQLRFLINRTNVPAKLKENVHAAEEFFEIVVVGHFIAAAYTILEWTIPMQFQYLMSCLELST